ncbi:MAG TPA: hypothetical protein VGF59_20235 [Bryobacteraceae bacterium]
MLQNVFPNQSLTSNTTLLSSDTATIVYKVTNTSAIAITLPPATQRGQLVMIVGTSVQATKTITINRATTTGDLIFVDNNSNSFAGVASVSTNAGMTLVSDGSGHWLQIY